MNDADRYVQDLEYCYTQQAELFWHTRKRERPETKYVLELLRESLSTFEWNCFHIVDLWCGTWRLAQILCAVDSRIRYTGVDFAQGMIDVATKEHASPQCEFVCADMVDFIERLEQGSVQMIVSYAAIQHLMSHTLRQQLFLAMYKVLDRNGTIAIVNWSYSERFVKKYWKQIIKSQIKVLLTVWSTNRSWNDVLIPWKWDWKAWFIKRYYHIFTPRELTRLAENASFARVECSYILQDGTSSSSDRTRSRNSLVTAVKALG